MEEDAKMPSKLKLLREERKMRREELAAAAGISLTYVRDLEEDRSNPSLLVARRVAEALGASVEEVVPAPSETDR